MNKIEIPLSKTKTTLTLVGSIVFVILGIIFIITPNTFNPPIIGNTMVIRIIGIVSVVFFGVISIFGLKKLFDKNLGLIIDENGITDNTNASSVGLIEWADITEIKAKQIISSKFLLIYTSNPSKYLDRVNKIQRRLMIGNMKMVGTPLSITPNTLKFNFKSLEKLLKERLVEQKDKISTP